jgi:serine/threonine protein phosphatase 1
LKTLKALIAQCPDVPITFVGDLIDRGPDSAGVIRLVRDNGWDCVQGNHELMSYAFDYRHDWCHPRNGGEQTIQSYEGLPKSQLAEDRDWLKTLPFVLEYPTLKNADGRSLIVTHSGIYHPDIVDSPDELVWNRKQPFDLKTKYNVFGHTPVKKPMIEKYFALIDTGAFILSSSWLALEGNERIEGLGLTGLLFPEMTVFFQPTID